MSTVSRGVRAVIGLVTGFFTLVFISQMFRYLPLAIAGDPLSLGMTGIYVILAYLGLTVTILLLKAKLQVWKYLSGVGLGVGALLFVSAVYLFTSDISSGLMLLILSIVQIGVSGLLYGVGQFLLGEMEETLRPQINNQIPTNHDTSTQSDPWWKTGIFDIGMWREIARRGDGEIPESQKNNQISTDDDISTQRDSWWKTGIFDLELWREIEWLRMGQIIVGAFVIVLGGLITIQSPVGVPVLLFGFILIPAVRKWFKERFDGQ